MGRGLRILENSIKTTPLKRLHCPALVPRGFLGKPPVVYVSCLKERKVFALRNERSLCPIPPATPKKAPQTLVNFVSKEEDHVLSRKMLCEPCPWIAPANRKANKIYSQPPLPTLVPFQGGVSFLSHIYLDIYSFLHHLLLLWSLPIPGFYPPNGRPTQLFQPSLRRWHTFRYGISHNVPFPRPR